MKNLSITAIALALSLPSVAGAQSCPAGNNFTIAIHGGAGVIVKEKLSDELEAEYRAALTNALTIGSTELKAGGSALDAAEAMVVSLENDPKFNAGKGAVFSAAGKNELDAAIMDGRDKNAGTVAGVTRVKNPIKLARAVMDNSKHVMLQSKGAEQFAKAQNLEIVRPKYFYTKRRHDQMKAKLKKQKQAEKNKRSWNESAQTKFGTVGAAVRDNCGNLAAATSTGGLTAKQFGRVGDTPIIGAGTYADNKSCAVSATGTGEYFIRATIAREICARREYLGESLTAAADHVIHKTLSGMGGDGGIVAVDNIGNYAFSFNTAGMYRGAVKNGEMVVEIFDKK